jgi:8-oxo-dGTP diphosphatase
MDSTTQSYIDTGGRNMDKFFGEKIKGYEYRPRQAVYGIIFDNTKEELVTVQTPDGYYWLPGGGIEGKENHHTCLRRELLEETGYEIEITGFVGRAKQYFITSNEDYVANEGNFYLAHLLTKVSEPIEDDHIIRWVPVEHVEEILYHQHQAWAVKKALGCYLNVEEG